MTTEHKPPGAGHGTFDLIDRSRLLEELPMGPSTVFVDIGSGRGDYTLAAADAIGPQGTVYAVDAWQDGLAEVERRAKARGIKTIRTLPADANKSIPLQDHIADVCLMATVLHDLLRESTGEVALKEVARVLKPGGRFAVIEFKKVADGPGPPLSIRLSEEEAEEVLRPFGFRKTRLAEVGKYHYLLIASLAL
jgi:ubiquinone/menaquinone biosynthesis C-methylase UbiE